MTARSGARAAQPKVRDEGKAAKRGDRGEAAGPRREKTSRREQAENTRRKLAETALRLFSSRGYDHVAVDDICLEAGVSKGTFYVHFASKDQVLLEEFLALDRFYTDSLAEIRGAGGGIERLLAFGRHSLRHISGLGKDHIKAAYSGQMAPGRGPSPLASPERASYQIALLLIREARESGELRRDLSAEETALALVRCIRGAVIEWCLTDGGFDLEQSGEPLLEILLEGVKARGVGAAGGGLLPPGAEEGTDHVI